MIKSIVERVKYRKIEDIYISHMVLATLIWRENY
jgi:hypothetical protein